MKKAFKRVEGTNATGLYDTYYIGDLRIDEAKNNFIDTKETLGFEKKSYADKTEYQKDMEALESILLKAGFVKL